MSLPPIPWLLCSRNSSRSESVTRSTIHHRAILCKSVLQIIFTNDKVGTMVLGSVIRKWRRASDIGAGEAAAMMGISTATLFRLERGAGVNGDVLAKVLRWLLVKGDAVAALSAHEPKPEEPKHIPLKVWRHRENAQ